MPIRSKYIRSMALCMRILGPACTGCCGFACFCPRAVACNADTSSCSPVGHAMSTPAAIKADNVPKATNKRCARGR
eukprot:CAMPEP_0176278100 /NCGR_PEP_ID=MMETSP0121_2-20121125/48612_1 /TAXON_ID=160619 /ORGANISM="Kryptoperidinium foliaceum, Strain CCMP 1326" /LENGTH=75 /DNA_ID=CAMNT_0017618407 /DNA_START=1 /DNA_END=228 /DNA_ORIENTATION=+